MFFTHLKRTIRAGYNNFTRSGFTSFASILMMVVTLFVITSLLFIQVALQSSLNEIKDKVDITVYFTPGASEEEIFEVKDALANLPEIESITYTSDIESLDKFKEKHSNDYLTLQALDELNENPLGATLNIKAKDPSNYESISDYFTDNNSLSKGAMTIIDKIDYHQNKVVIDRLNSIISGASKLGFIFSFILILISIIITFNTIRLIIYMSRDEINVMRLVGAGKRYVQGPFMVSGILVGLVASISTIIIFIPISIWLGNEMTDFIGINLFDYFKSNFIEIFSILIITGVLLSGISSYFAVMRYLNKIK
jgi:cell division transport system permease protein